MSALADLVRVRAERDALRADFDARLAVVRADIDARSVPGRVADSAVHSAQDMAGEALAIADENRAVVVGTIAALAVWLLRTPIIALACNALGIDRTDQD